MIQMTTDELMTMIIVDAVLAIIAIVMAIKYLREEKG